MYKIPFEKTEYVVIFDNYYTVITIDVTDDLEKDFSIEETPSFENYFIPGIL